MDLKRGSVREGNRNLLQNVKVGRIGGILGHTCVLLSQRKDVLS